MINFIKTNKDDHDKLEQEILDIDRPFDTSLITDTLYKKQIKDDLQFIIDNFSEGELQMRLFKNYFYGDHLYDNEGRQKTQTRTQTKETVNDDDMDEEYDGWS